jgi:hypothetical protein
MAKALIRLAYKHVIDSNSQVAFEKDVFNDTYSEFLMQALIYNNKKKFTTFEQMINNNPKANSLHYKVGFAIWLYVKDLNNQIPGLKDSLDIFNVPSESYKLHIIESDITKKQAHKVAIIYRTDTFILFDTIDENMVVAKGDFITVPDSVQAETFIIKIQPALSIFSWV